MSRRELVALLVLLVRSRKLTTAEARQIMALFDAGELGEDLLPLPLRAALAPAEEQDASRAILALLLLLGIVQARRFLLARPTATGAAGQAVPLFARAQARNSLRTAFTQQANTAAAQLAQSGNIAAWHTSMAANVRQHILRNAMAGRGRPLTAAELQALQPVMREQMTYLYRFAGEAAARQAAGNAFSEAAIASRARQYAGEGLAAWYRGNEGDGEANFVYDYIAIDDKGTCSFCYDADRGGPYLAGAGPMPGEICVAKGWCRCRREARYAPEEYARLTGRQQAA